MNHSASTTPSNTTEQTMSDIGQGGGKTHWSDYAVGMLRDEIMWSRAEIERLRLQVDALNRALCKSGDERMRQATEAAAFIDGLAEWLESSCRVSDKKPAADCRAMAKKLKGQSPHKTESPACHPEGFWCTSKQIGPDAWQAVCSVCGRPADQAT